MHPELLQVGYYISPEGGAGAPARILREHLLLECLTQGEVIHPVTGEGASAGHLFLHRSGEVTIFQTGPGERYECLTAMFRLPDQEQAELKFPRSLFWPDRSAVEAFAREVLHAAHYESMALNDLGNYIWATLRFRLARDQQRTLTEAMPGPVVEALRCVQKQPGKDWSLDHLAEQCGWSVSHLHAEFKRCLGKTPHQVLLGQRMAEARHRLVRSRDPIKEIAYDVGFSNTENFCRVFKKNHGQTAGAFRRQYQILSRD